MHSFIYRTNALLTAAGTVLVVMCVLASVTDCFHEAHVDAKIKQRVEGFGVDNRNNEEAKLAVSLDVDLRPVFTWNTKQIFVYLQVEYSSKKNWLNQVTLWDLIIQKKDQARIDKKLRQKYKIDDQGKNLRGTPFNLTLSWMVMPRVGRLYTQQQTISGFTFPDAYI